MWSEAEQSKAGVLVDWVEDWVALGKVGLMSTPNTRAEKNL